jgi:LSD1 subclass zinc finger protein
MKYICPAESCRASYTLDETYYRGARSFQCSKCNTLSRIPLYCPTCWPKSAEQKGYLETPERYLGGETFRCSRGHTFTVPVFQDDARAQLTSLGAPIGVYNQSARLEQLADATLKKEVSGGYCAGAVLDWVRRAVQGGKVTYADVAPRQDRRAAVAWVENSKKTKDAFLKREMDAINDERAKSFKAGQVEVNDAAHLRDKAAVADLNRRLSEYAERQGMTQPMYDQLAALARASYQMQLDNIEHDRVQGVEAARAKANADAAAKTSSPIMERFWKQFSTKMDAVLDKDRAARGKRGPTSRGFSNLIVAKSVDTMEFAGGVKALIEAVVHDPAFHPNFAAYVSITPPLADATGHAIGILRRNTGDRFVMFDPNYGTFEFTGTNLKEAVQFLFKRAYPHSPSAVGSDSHVYEINGRVKGSYTIFENTGACSPTVAPSSSVAAAAAAAGADSPRQLRSLTTQ